MKAKVGDRIVLEGNKVGHPAREGEIVEVSGEHVRVRWGDGHETVLFPRSDARVVRPSGGRRR